MKIFIWEISDKLVLITRGSVCAKSEKEALEYIANSLSSDEKSMLKKCKLKITRV